MPSKTAQAESGDRRAVGLTRSRWLLRWRSLSSTQAIAYALFGSRGDAEEPATGLTYGHRYLPIEAPAIQLFRSAFKPI
jgi:hypothetical protein